MNHEIQDGEKSSPYVLCVYLREGVRYVVAGYMHGELFYKTVIAAGFTDGENEADLVDPVIKWFYSTAFEACLPIAISSDGSVGRVSQFIRNVGTQLGGPILEQTYVDEVWLANTLREAFGPLANPWGFVEKFSIAAGGVFRSGLLQALPKLSKVGIFTFSF